jgi:hypothetical protein
MIPEPVAEFLEFRVRWLELQPALADPNAPPLLRTLALLLEKEERLPATTAQIRSTVAGTAMEDFSKSVAYREIFGLGEARGREQGLEQGLKIGELELTMRLLQRRCGGLTPSQEARIRALPLPQLEALAEAVLDFQAAADLEAWLATS